MCLSSARGTESRPTPMTSPGRSQGWGAMPTPPPSAWGPARKWVAGGHHLDDQRGEVGGVARNAHAAAFGMGQRQQLVDGVRGADAGAADLLQRAPDLLGAGVFALG